MAKTSQQYKDLSVKEFTKAAKSYESDHAGVYELCKKDYPFILEEIEKEPFETLLDAGCGPAPMIYLLAEKYPDKHYTGIDLTPAMIETARSKHIPNAEFVVGDCENLPFRENSFDIIICSMSAHHYPNIQNFFHSVCRCLKPNGRFILRDMTSDYKMIRWMVRNIEMPLANLIGHGDVDMLHREECDACAMMCVVDPDYVKSTISCHGSCITDPGETYGQVIFYQEGLSYDMISNNDYDYNVSLVSDVDKGKYFDLYLNAIQ